MRWEDLLSASRLGGKPQKRFDGRSPFLSDHDKIIFSEPFRRLAKKTQVHPLATNDHIHNRLIHSLEVACIGRSLAMQVGYQLKEINQLPNCLSPSALGDIVQTTCLAHDLGNPPFGHTGEDAISKWFVLNESCVMQTLTERQKNDLIHFEGNAQGFRLLTASESAHSSSMLSMTYATLGAFIKYPWCSDATGQKKYGVYDTEIDLLDEVAEHTGLIKTATGYARHPLVYLMEASDDICYALLDLEDGIEMRLTTFDDIYHVFSPLLAEDTQGELNDRLMAIKAGQVPSVLRGYIMDIYISRCAKAYIEHLDVIMTGQCDDDLIRLADDAVYESVTKAKQLAVEKIFTHPRKVELEIGAYEIIYRLLDKMIPAVQTLFDTRKTCDKEQDMVLRLIGKEKLIAQPSYYHALRVTLDFIGGMTDNYAMDLSRQFAGLSN
ncbi:MAG: deoxyguanosinetriphosphate triphosphohydrolase [Cellvibrionales bacterium]|nr:deoxyguanosinetriphosphate triphosphohydrolase [Cellvibrionales bacterium]